METGLDFTVIWTNITHFMIGRYPSGPMGGVLLTLYLAAVSLVLSFFGGLILGLMCVSRNPLVRYPTLAVVNTIRGIPLLLVIFWMYFLLPTFLGYRTPESWTVIAALTIFTFAYMSQIVQAGIEGIPSGQMEAARSSGFSYLRSMLYIILPQAVRITIPPLINQFLNLAKNSSLAMTIGVAELTYQARQVESYTFKGFEAFTAATLVYLVISLVITGLMTLYSKKVLSPIGMR